MRQVRNGERPLTARSVVASTLLGIDPPRLSGQLLVRSGELFGIAEGTTRTALSRMVAAGELVTDDGVYELSGRLRERQARQVASRAADVRHWDDTWRVAVVVAERRRPPDRADLRTAMAAARLAEWREGIWLRPDNLPAVDDPVIARQCRWVVGARPAGDPSELAAELWDLHGWARRARTLRERMASVVDDLEAGTTDALAPGFVLSAAVLRHFLADPLLPAALLPTDWPGAELRQGYDRYDRAYRAVWRAWFRRFRAAR